MTSPFATGLGIAPGTTLAIASRASLALTSRTCLDLRTYDGCARKLLCGAQTAGTLVDCCFKQELRQGHADVPAMVTVNL